MAAGIACGMGAFVVLFLPILPVSAPQEPGALVLPMPEAAAAGPQAPQPARQSLIAALMPASAPSWLQGNSSGKTSIVAVALDKAREALGMRAACASSRPTCSTPRGFSRAAWSTAA